MTASENGEQMKTRHTPGPWYPGHLGDPSTSCECRIVVDEGYAGGICTVHVDNGKMIANGGNDAPPLDEAIANMHIIAAAPDFYAAAMLRRAYESLPSDRGGRNGPKGMARAMWLAAEEAAIAKAVGRQS